MRERKPDQNIREQPLDEITGEELGERQTAAEKIGATKKFTVHAGDDHTILNGVRGPSRGRRPRGGFAGVFIRRRDGQYSLLGWGGYRGVGGGGCDEECLVVTGSVVLSGRGEWRRGL